MRRIYLSTGVALRADTIEAIKAGITFGAKAAASAVVP